MAPFSGLSNGLYKLLSFDNRYTNTHIVTHHFGQFCMPYFDRILFVFRRYFNGFSTVFRPAYSGRISVVFRQHFDGISAVFWPYSGRIPAVFRLYFNRISTVFRPYFGLISTVFPLYFGRISTIFRLFLDHFLASFWSVFGLFFIILLFHLLLIWNFLVRHLLVCEMIPFSSLSMNSTNCLVAKTDTEHCHSFDR